MADTKKEATWIAMQRKAFTGWCNIQLKKRGFGLITPEDLEVAFVDGIKLAELCKAISPASDMPKLNKKARIRPQKADNITRAFAMAKKIGIQFPGTGETNLMDGDQKMVFGMVWVIICYYASQGLSAEDQSFKEGLLLWVRRNTTPAPYNLDVTNFTNCWQDGLAFCALIHAFRPDLLDYESLDAANKKENLELAFGVAEKDLDIPRLLDADDMLAAKPDERAVMTYVSEYFHKFANFGKLEAAGRRVGNLISITQQNRALQEEFESKAKAFRDWVEAKKAEHEKEDYADNHEDLRSQLGALRDYKRGEKAEKAGEKVDIESVFNNYQAKLRLQGRQPYQPAEGLSPSDLDALWRLLMKVDRERQDALRRELKRRLLEEQLLKRWASKTKRMHLRLDLLNEDAAEVVVDAGLAWSLDTVLPSQKAMEDLHAEFEGLTPLWSEIEALAGRIEEAGLDGTKYTDYTLDSIRAEYDAARENLSNQNSAVAGIVDTQRANDALCKEYASQADSFAAWLDERAADLNAPLDGEADAQLEAVRAKRESLAAGQEPFNTLTGANQKVEDAGILENPYTEHEYEALAAQFQHLPKIADDKEKTIVASTTVVKQEVSEAQLAEFKETFDVFDKDNSGTLQDYEFQSCLSALGQEVSGAELQAVLNKYDGDKDGKITFTEFVQFMLDRMQDEDSSDQILDSFKILSGGKPFILEADLRAGGLDDEQVAYCLANMPKYTEDEAGEGDAERYDYTAFTHSVYTS